MLAKLQRFRCRWFFFHIFSFKIAFLLHLYINNACSRFFNAYPIMHLLTDFQARQIWSFYICLQSHWLPDEVSIASVLGIWWALSVLEPISGHTKVSSQYKPFQFGNLQQLLCFCTVHHFWIHTVTFTVCHHIWFDSFTHYKF